MNKKRVIYGLLSICMISSLLGCSSSSSNSNSSNLNTTKIGVDMSPFNNDTTGLYVSDKEGKLITTYSLYPFNTSISMTYFTTDGKRDSAFESEFVSDFQYYNSLFDRHRYYSNNGTLVNNIKVFNDSYGTSTPVKLDDELYSSLKRSYEFSLNSDGKFSIAIGNLSSLWDYYISNSTDYSDEDVAGKYYSDSVAQKRAIFTDPSSLWVEAATNTTPTTSELKDMLTFNDEDKTVTFNSVSRIDEYVSSHKDLINTIKNTGEDGMDFSSPSITLGGYGKGEATELFSSKHKDRVFLVNSGQSSVKCIGIKPDNSAWNITIANPYYNEASRVGYFDDITLNSADLIYSYSGDFNLSTSAYYNNYFYSVDSNGKYHLRSHIIDQTTGYSNEVYDSNSGEYHSFFASTSVLLSGSGYADMYTTALMNCSSFEEAEELLTKLNKFTGMNAIPYFLCNTKVNGKKKTTCYVSSSLYSSFKYYSDLYPNYVSSSYNITTIEQLSF